MILVREPTDNRYSKVFYGVTKWWRIIPEFYACFYAIYNAFVYFLAVALAYERRERHFLFAWRETHYITSIRQKSDKCIN